MLNGDWSHVVVNVCLSHRYIGHLIHIFQEKQLSNCFLLTNGYRDILQLLQLV